MNDTMGDHVITTYIISFPLALQIENFRPSTQRRRDTTSNWKKCPPI
jgi:hypothetical protein